MSRPFFNSPVASCLHHATLWRAWLSLPGDCLSMREKDDAQRLWLLLGDGRVLVFRLGSNLSPGDALAFSLATAVLDDRRGDVLELNLPENAWAGVLYGAPASPVFCVDPAHPAFAQALAFHACLDGEVLALLASWSGSDHFWASARNYSRLLAHPRCSQRLQALRRYPLLLPPVLLTHQRRPNLSDVKRFRWRAHDDELVEAIDQGRDLTGALAAYYGISRGLVRSPFCAQAWSGSGGRSRVELLQFLDAIPAHRRPASGAEIDACAQHLPAFWGLFGDYWRGAAVVFREGFTVVWQRLLQRFDSPEHPLNTVIMDAGDYLNGLVAWLGATHRLRLASGELAALWVQQRGLVSLLAASIRWHARRSRIDVVGWNHLPESVPAVIGEWSDGAWSVRELWESEALYYEGEAMHHCIGDYWPDCVLQGGRAFAFSREELSLDHEKTKRATAWFELEDAGDALFYALEQIRGPANVVVDDAMQEFAERFEKILNAPERAARRKEVWRCSQQSCRLPAHNPAGRAIRIDPESIATLNALLDLPRTLSAISLSADGS